MKKSQLRKIIREEIQRLNERRRWHFKYKNAKDVQKIWDEIKYNDDISIYDIGEYSGIDNIIYIKRDDKDQIIYKELEYLNYNLKLNPKGYWM